MSISVIIPVKNRAHLLVTTLNNILGQSLAPQEIIVVDDHSTDNIQEIKGRFSGKIIFIENSGTGPGAARNTGYLASTGKYIQFFDSDDLMTNDKLEIQFNQLELSSSAMAYCPHVKAIEDEKGNWKQSDTILYFKPFSKRLRYDQWVIRGACMITQACLFKRDLIQDSGLWRTDLMPHEDLEFLFRIGKIEPYPIHSNIPAVIYRQHSFQITDKSTTVDFRALDHLKALSLIYENVKRDKGYTFVDKLIIENKILRTTSFVQPESRPHDFSSIKYASIKKNGYPIQKIIDKVQRVLTNSDWLFFHGVNNDPVQFQSYINKIGKFIAL